MTNSLKKAIAAVISAAVIVGSAMAVPASALETKAVEADQSPVVVSFPSTDEGVAFLVTAEGRTVFHAGDLNWWHWEGEDPVWNRNMEADFRRYAEPLRGRKIDLAMLPLDPRLGEDGFRGPRYFLELADIRRFLPMHQWGNFNFTNQFLSCYTSFTSRTVYVNRVGQVFTFEEEADT